MGEPDKVALRAALESAGWRVQLVEHDEWWVHECWRITSTWRPVTAQAYVTLLVDPQAPKSAVGSVWAIALSHDLPRDRIETGRVDIRTSPRWPDRKAEIVKAAAGFRD
jgi:hypothetical protein